MYNGETQPEKATFYVFCCSDGIHSLILHKCSQIASRLKEKERKKERKKESETKKKEKESGHLLEVMRETKTEDDRG